VTSGKGKGKEMGTGRKRGKVKEGKEDIVN
jgi:hypothetical protein